MVMSGVKKEMIDYYVNGFVNWNVNEREVMSKLAGLYPEGFSYRYTGLDAQIQLDELRISEITDVFIAKIIHKLNI